MEQHLWILLVQDFQLETENVSRSNVGRFRLIRSIPCELKCGEKREKSLLLGMQLFLHRLCRGNIANANVVDGPDILIIAAMVHLSPFDETVVMVGFLFE